jgi:hypothetical protein
MPQTCRILTIDFVGYIFLYLYLYLYLSACSFRWIIVAESIVRWFIVREKHCWMTADSAEPAKRIGCVSVSVSIYVTIYNLELNAL